MEMSKESADNIVQQLQQAHRISVAFYKRILPTLDMIANKFGCVFYVWEPLITDFPGSKKGKSQPSQSWAWEYVPLYASSHTYRYVRHEKKTTPEDLGIIFDLYIEDSFSDKTCDKGQPDPIHLLAGKAVLQVYLYRPKKAVNKSFDDLWKEETENDVEFGIWKSVSENWNGISFEWSLSDVICDNKVVIQELQKHIKLTE